MKSLTLGSILLTALVVVGAAQQQGLSPAMASLVETERAFARTSVERGVRDSFLMFFAKDGINFKPHPTNTREAMLKLPPLTSPSPITLEWAPVFGDVSIAGDLGYTTGPYWIIEHKSADKKPTQHGYFFSIWKKQPEGDWKVVVDLGIRTPPPITAEVPSFRPARHPAAKRAAISPQSLLETDREFGVILKARGMTEGFLAFASDDARVYRNGLMPIIGSEAIRSYLSQKMWSFRSEPLKSDISTSGDLGYTYGKYELRETPSAAEIKEQGYYVRVWKRNDAGNWKVVLDVTTALPKDGN